MIFPKSPAVGAARPVPPFAGGRVPVPNPMMIVPLVVIGEPVTERKLGT